MELFNCPGTGPCYSQLAKSLRALQQGQVQLQLQLQEAAAAWWAVSEPQRSSHADVSTLRSGHNAPGGTRREKELGQKTSLVFYMTREVF